MFKKKSAHKMLYIGIMRAANSKHHFHQFASGRVYEDEQEAANDIVAWAIKNGVSVEYAILPIMVSTAIYSPATAPKVPKKGKLK